MSSILLRTSVLPREDATRDVVRFPWLYDRNWDLVFLIFSAVLCVVPYAGYLFSREQITQALS